MGTEMATSRARRTRSGSRGSTARSRADGWNPARRRKAAGSAMPWGACPSSYVETRRISPSPRTGLPLARRRHVIRRQLRALAEEELLRLLEEDLVGAGVSRGQPVLVHDHLEVLEPHLPGFLGDGVVDALAEIVRERLEGHPGQLAPELFAVDR